VAGGATGVGVHAGRIARPSAAVQLHIAGANGKAAGSAAIKLPGRGSIISGKATALALVVLVETSFLVLPMRDIFAIPIMGSLWLSLWVVRGGAFPQSLPGHPVCERNSAAVDSAVWLCLSARVPEVPH
jgi:hypothetical protein